MRTALIGLPQSGKTTLGGAVSGTMPDAAGPPQVRHTVVKVPDDRVHVLAKMYNPKKVTEATIEYIDVPGFSLADHRGQEDLRRFLPDIRQADLLVAVIRTFVSDSVPAYRDRVDPAADFEELREELIYADLESVSNRIEKLEKALRKPTKTHDQEKRELELLTECRETLEDSKPLSAVPGGEERQRMVTGFGLLSAKPLVVVYNVSEQDAAAPDPHPPEMTAGAINLCALTELEITQLDPNERGAFLEDLGVQKPARERLIGKCYQALGLISFLTVGREEVRATTVKKGSDALEAAGRIHSDMARGFIRAETVAFSDLMEAGDMKAAKASAKVRQEGKHYIVQDGDVINFKFNV
ncbi:MAG: DUF933 domain-containing protein [Phycisphaerae bacterium]